MNIEDIGKKRDQFIEAARIKFDKQAAKIQKDLLDLIYAKFIDKFDVVNGELAPTEKNFRLIADIDRIYDEFAKTYQNEIVRGFAKTLTEMTIVTAEYYKDVGVAEKTVENIAAKMGWIDKALGVQDNKVVAGSYLDRLAQSQEVRQQLKDYVLGSVSGKKGFSEYRKGFQTLVEGTKDVNGAVEGYWKQYTWDTYNQVESVKSAFFADQVGFDYFIYSGVIITTSREFCIKRAGKVFSREDALTWLCDPDLLRRKGVTGCDPTYNPFVERGRWNCRHRLDWIGKEVAEDLGITEMRF